MHGRNGFVAVIHAHLEQTGVFDEACGGNAQIARRASCDREVMTRLMVGTRINVKSRLDNAKFLAGQDNRARQSQAAPERHRLDAKHARHID